MSQPQQPAPAQVGRLINLIPVGLKEAAIDSPTSRASVIHFTEQIDIVEKWLEDYMKSINRLITEYMTLESIVTHLLSHASLPATISESVLDHDYSVLAMRRYEEGAKGFLMGMVSVVKRLSALVVEPIRLFLLNDLRAFKDVRRNFEQCQKNFDNLQSKFAAHGKSKEPSSLREDAFQLHEARKLYLKASMDIASIAPQLRFSLDKLVVRVFFDQWREMRISCDDAAATFQKTAQEMERVKGWIREMESSEKTFRKDLITARKQLEEAAELNHRPSRELEDYAAVAVPYVGIHPQPGGANVMRSPRKMVPLSGEKQGWLYLRTYAGKPTRTVWIKRWAYVRNGIFGWLVQGVRPGGVEESERVGVLLCNIRPAPSEDRRFCFEVKTNKNTILLQAETQGELAAWIGAFETAKSKALEDPGASHTLATSLRTHSDPAFAISPPPVPEFGTLVLNLLEPGASDDTTTVERTNTLLIPGVDSTKESIDLSRKSTGFERDEFGRDHATRIISKLDLGRKSPAIPQMSPSASMSNMGGGIASLIAASHTSMPVGPSLPMIISEPEPIRTKSMFSLNLRDMPPSTLAPSTLANPPAPTNLSKTAVIVTGERRISAAAERAGIPHGILANMWGSANLSYVNRLERVEPRTAQDGKSTGQPSPLVLPASSAPKGPDLSSMSTLDLSLPRDSSITRTPSPEKRHRNTISLDGDAAKQARIAIGMADFPSYYPVQLKTQDAQFRLLFPTVRRDERLVLVFRATWNPNDQQDFPGRAYVTTKEIYFYSNHLGLVLTSGVCLSSIDEVTAAPGRECDFLFLHMKDAKDDGSPTRITIKTFLEPLTLLQRRLNFLARNSVADEPHHLEDVVKILLKMESEAPERTPSLESWEDISPDTPVDSAHQRNRPRASTIGTDLKAPVRVDRTLSHSNWSFTAQGQKIAKFKLPAQPVIYKPPGNLRLAVEKEVDVSPKALFHVLFGDKSAVWQLVLRERRAKDLKQGPWINIGDGILRRNFDYNIPKSGLFTGTQVSQVRDYQVVDVNSDHLCYVVTDKRTAWHLPYRQNYRLVSKIVITHVAKAKCKLAVFVKVEWLRTPWLLKNLIEQQAMNDLELDALDLTDLASDQVRKLGSHSRTKKAIQIYGQLGQSIETIHMKIDNSAMNIEMRRVPVEHTALDLLLQGTGTVAESIAVTVLGGIFEVVRWMWKTCSANRVILALLVASMLFNGWYSSRDGLAWWHERNARDFMSRLGVSPNHVMSKAIYISDLQDMLSEDGDLPSRESSACYTIFHDSHQLDDLDAPLLPLRSESSSAPRKSAQRMQHTRQRLGTYRHDLLVAMRVVNSIEREVLKSEWEHWVRQEHRRCRQVEGLLALTSNDSNAAPANILSGMDGEVERWYEEYCMSCKREHERLAADVG